MVGKLKNNNFLIKGGNMVVKLKDLKMLPPNHKIFKVPFFTVSHNTSEGKKKIHPTEVRPGMSAERIKKNLLKALKKNGIEVKDDK